MSFHLRALGAAARLAVPHALLAALLALTAGCSKEEEPGPKRDACGYHQDCPNQGVCYRGECYPTVSCLERRNCRNLEVCADDRCICESNINRCLPVCVTDDDCPSEGHCLNGVCEPHPVQQFPGVAPESGPRGALKAGLGAAPLDFPMGVELAGYGSRTGPRTPYTRSLGGSNAWLDRPEVRALAFDDGKEMFVLLRIPLSWTTDFMVARTAVKVAEKTGLDLRGRILTSAPHSHSEPARYWHLVVGLGFGFFGYGEFMWEVFERLTDSFADAVIMAVENLEPARFGYVMLEGVDPDNRIFRDRRRRNNNLPNYIRKDDRMVVMRVDDAAGQPLAVLTHFGIHGTVFGSNNPMITGDAGGGVEVELDHAVSAKYGRPVTGFFIQGNAGDVSPGGDDLQHTDAERIQLLGRRSWAVIEPALERIETSSDVHVSVITSRIPITHEALGYGPGDFHDVNVSCDNSPDYFRYGAFQCVEGYFEDEDPATAFSDGNLACVFAVECLTDGHPIPQFQKTVLTVARLGGLLLASMPGEPTSQFGRDISEALVTQVPGASHGIVVGYSQDHHFYLLNEDDWLQGGYEPSRVIWGWRLGPYLVENAMRLARELNKEPEARVIDEGNLKPMYWPSTDEERAPVAFTESEGNPTEILQAVPGEVERLSEVQLAWRGGHPGLDLPRVFLEREDGGSFAQVLRPGGKVYDDAGFEMVVVYEGSCDRINCINHRWRVRWQEDRDFPAGRYRLRVEGQALYGGRTGRYEVETPAFEVVPSRRLHLWGLRAEGGRIEGRIAEPPQVALSPEGEGQRADRNAFFLRSTEVPAWIGAPLPESAQVQVSGTIRAPGEAPALLDGTASLARVTERRQRLVGYDAAGAPRWEDERDRPTTRFTVESPVLANGPSGDYLLELTLTDELGNAGTVTATISK